MTPSRKGRTSGEKKELSAAVATRGALVLNLNFSIDKTALIPVFERCRVYRLAQTISLPGGKGVNVARALRELGVTAPLAGFASGCNGLWIERALRKQGLKAAVERHCAGESRMCLTVVDKQGGSMDFNEEGPAVPGSAQRRFLRRLRRVLLPATRLMAICGRTPAGLKKGFYADIVGAAAARGCFTAADVSGPALAEVLSAGVEALKINREEFSELTGASFSASGLYSFFRRRQPRGLKTLIVTGGADLAYAASPFGLWSIKPVPLPLLASPVGAGDCFMAGFICGFLRGYDFERTLRLSAGAAACDCLSLGAGFITRTRTAALAGKVLVTKIR